MRMKQLYAVVMTGILLLFVFGCRSDAYYQNRAVERARSYLLERSTELGPDQIAYIQFNDPVLLTAPVYTAGRAAADSGSKLDTRLEQICIAWTVPGKQELYMVFGTSTGRMDFWTPNRVIKKAYISVSLPLQGATETARRYAVSNLLNVLDMAVMNLVRFTPPFVLQTDFPLVLDPTGTLSSEKIAANEAKLQTQTQYSLVWKSGVNAESVVFCGTSQPSLNGWELNFAGVLSDEEVAKHTIATVKTPAQFDTPIDPAVIKK